MAKPLSVEQLAVYSIHWEPLSVLQQVLTENMGKRNLYVKNVEKYLSEKFDKDVARRVGTWTHWLLNLKRKSAPRCFMEQFVQRVKRNSTLTELTPYALRELVKAVYVEAPDKSSGKRRQKVHIEYDLVGYIPVDEPLKAEQA